MTAQRTPIYQGQDFFVPAFQVMVGSRRLTQEEVFDITQVSYKDSMDQVDSFEITINNWDARTRTFKYSDGELFDPGKRVSLAMGYRGATPLRVMLTGEITSLRPTFPAGGQPTLAISGLSLLHRLRTKQQSQVYTNKTDSQMAREVAGRLGIPIDTPSESGEQPYPYVLQANQYDALFLMQRAHRAGYDIFVKEEDAAGQPAPSRLYFGRSTGVKRKTYTLDYGSSLTEFQPTLTTANQVGSVTVRAWDAVHKRLIEGKATRSGLETKGVGAQGGQSAIEQSFNQREEIIADHPVANQAEADRLARETLENIAKDMVKATASTVGLPELRAGSLIYVTGVGERFSGWYFVTGTTHTIGDSGYTTQFECRREETGQQ